MKKILSLLSLLLLVSLGARADEAFRLHRYDTFKVEPITTNSIVFVGNSITDMHLWAEAFGNDSRIVNRGNSGARSAEILANVKSYCAGKPAKIFLMIGINDLHDGVQAATIASNIQQTIATIKQTSPATKIYVQSILPSTYANDLYNITNCNTAIQNMLSNYGYSDVTYIDLYASLLGKVDTDTSGRYSFDALHLTAAGYEIWTKAIESHLDGLTSQYPASALSLQNNGSLSSSFGARATYFSMMPIASGDVLFFGDEMVKNGEWNELLGNYNVKNRGTNWDYDKSTYATIENTRGGIVSTFASVSGVRKDAPKQILLYTGTGEVNGTSDINTIFSSYTQLITLIRQYAPAAQTKISLVSLMPTSATSNSRVTGFNDLLRNYVNTYGASQNLEYIDIYTPLSTAGGSKRSDYFPAGNNYLYGDGYITVANVLADYIDGCHPVTPEQAAAYRALIEQAGNVEEPTPAEEGIVGGKQYTIQPYGTTKYVVPSLNWSNRGGNMTSYSTATPSVENGAVWTFQTMNGGFAIKPASNNYTAAYLNPWNACSVTSNALGVWDDSGDDQTWYVTPVDGMEHVYTLRNKGNSTAYMYYNPSASELYFNKPNTPTTTNYFVIEPFGEEAAPEQPTPQDNGVLWTGNINNPTLPWMRIPSIVKTQTGDLLAFADYRYNHDDIGRNNSLNNGRIDIQMRRSVNNGETWSNYITVARGSGEYNSTDAGYGDAAVAVDNGGSGKVLLLAAAGSVNYGNTTRSNPIRMAKFTSNNNGQSWSSATDITSTFYGLLPGVTGAFSTSGRIEQSVLRKNGAAYNRIYNALCTKSGNYVLYSDDFGETWAVLGGCAQTSGDEAHVVELPNGDLLLVSRKASDDGRYINLFTYPKNAQGMADFSQSGSWSTSGYTNNTSAARCNGDIDIVSACAAGNPTPTYLLIQTAPYSSSPRRDVGYFYKELPAPNQSGNYSLYDFTTGWTRGLQVSDKASAYSSIVNIDYNTEAILFEESENAVAIGSSDPYAYNIVFKKHTIAEITKGAYVGAEPVTPPVVDPDPEDPDPEDPDPEDPASDPLVLELQTVINAVYAHAGQVGYPADMSSIATYAGSGVTTTNYAEASAALNSLYSATTIVLPEAGKAYRLAMVKSDGTKVYLGANAALSTDVEDAVTLVVGRNEGNVNHPFFFVTEDGNFYLNHRGTDSGTYSGGVNNFAIDAMVSRVGNSSVTKSVEECFGYVFLTSESRVEENMSYYVGCMIMTQKDNSWNGSSAPYYDKDFTSAISFEEVNNSNLVKLSNPNPGGTSSLDGKCVGTFSAPYITRLPAGVKAYTAAVNAAKTTVVFNELGTVVPAHTGVLVYAPEVDGSISANAVPATAADAVDPNNLFEPTDGTDIPEGSFILAKGADGVGFYLIGNNRVVAKNKAYLALPDYGSNLKFRFDFEEDVTAIAGIEAVPSASVYDLQGRRVSPRKLRSEGGVYIANGKKIIR